MRKLLLISLVLIFVLQSVSFAAEDSVITQFAKENNLVLDEGIPLYNFNDDIVAYNYNNVNGKGFVIKNTFNNDIVEYSLESDNKQVSKNKKNYYNGALAYYNKSDITTRSLDFEIYGTKDFPINENANLNERSTRGRKSLPYGLPNYSYNPTGICGSTASAMYVRYFDLHFNNKYVPKNLESSNGIKLIKHLVKYVDKGGHGSKLGDLTRGLGKYLDSRGMYNHDVRYTKNIMSGAVGIIHDKKPYILGLHKYPLGSKTIEHWCTGKGYIDNSSTDYAIVNDGWGGTRHINVKYCDYVVY
jgi:hypothetical protein